MIRIAKVLLLVQVIGSALLLPLLFDMPLEIARLTHVVRNVADQLTQQGLTATATQATFVADILHAWGKRLPVMLAGLSIAGVLIGLTGWLALNQKAKSTANQADEDTARKLADSHR